MKRTILLCLSLFLFTGCVSTKNIPLAESERAKLKGKDITVSYREKPSFSAMTAGKAMFGMVGAAAMINAGNKIIQDNQVEDPAVYIGTQMANSLADKYGVLVLDPQTTPLKSENVADIATRYVDVPYVLDVRTVNWSFVYFPTDWDSYRVLYSARLRLIDTATKKSISQGFCNRTPEKTEDAPSKDELLANNAERLKYELQQAAEYCIAQFEENLLTL